MDLLTLSGIGVMAFLAVASVRLHLKSRSCAKGFNEDHNRWHAIRGQETEVIDFDMLRTGVEKNLAGPLGQVLLLKLKHFPSPDVAEPATISEKIQEALEHRSPEAELDGMARLAMYLTLGNIVGTLATSAFLNNAVVFAVGLAGILLNMGTLGRVESLRGIVTRITALLGGAFVEATHAAGRSERTNPAD